MQAAGTRWNGLRGTGPFDVTGRSMGLMGPRLYSDHLLVFNVKMLTLVSESQPSPSLWVTAQTLASQILAASSVEGGPRQGSRLCIMHHSFQPGTSPAEEEAPTSWKGVGCHVPELASNWPHSFRQKGEPHVFHGKGLL